MLTMSTLDLEGCGGQGQTCLRNPTKKSLTLLWYEIWLPPLRSPSFAKRCIDGQFPLSSPHPVDRARGQVEFAECDYLANQVRNLHLIFPELDDVTYGMNNLLVLALCLCTQLVRLVFDRWSPNDFSKSPISRHIPPSPWDVGIPSENLSCVLIPFQLSVHAKRDTFLLRHLHGFYGRERHRLLCYVAIWHLPLMIGIWGKTSDVLPHGQDLSDTAHLVGLHWTWCM